MRANAAELAGAQNISGIREGADNTNGAGLRIHLTVGEDDTAGMRIDLAVGERQAQRHVRCSAATYRRRC